MSLIDRIVPSDSKQQQLLHRLRQTGESVAILGAGTYAYLLRRYLQHSGIGVDAFLVNGGYKSSDQFMGLPVRALDDDIGTLADRNVVVGVANYPPVVDELRARGLRAVHVIDVPDFLNIPEPFMDWAFVNDHRADFRRVEDLWADDLSRETYIAAINTKLCEDLAHIKPYVRLDHLHFPSTEFALTDEESLLDVGGFNGDSVRDFYAISKGKFRSVLSFEPFAASYRQLVDVVEEIGDPRIRTLKLGAWDERASLRFATEALNIDNRIASDGSELIEVDSIDAVIAESGDRVTLIKMDINGAEYRAVRGARVTIARHRPQLALNVNVKEDLIRLPLLLREIAPTMRLYLRQRNYMSMMLMLYGVFDGARDRAQAPASA